MIQMGQVVRSLGGSGGPWFGGSGYGLFTLHENWTGTGTGKWPCTIVNNWTWFFLLSGISVNISVQYIRIHYSWSRSLYLSLAM